MTDDRRRENLGPRQVAVLAGLEQHGRLTAEAAGRIVHSEQGKHAGDVGCDFCEHDGRTALRSLRARGLARWNGDAGAWEPEAS